MQPPIQRAVTSQAAPASSTGHNPQGLHQGAHPPTQHSGHSLGELGQRAAAAVGPLIQDLDTPTAASAKPGMARSGGGRFDGRNERIQRQPAANATAPSVQLDAKGVADFKDFKPSAIGALLQDVLGRAGHHYQASHSALGGQDHLLLDQQDHVLHVKQSPTALVAVRSSQAQGAGSTAPSLVHQDGLVQVDRGGEKSAPLQALGRAHLGLLTGIHQDRDAQPLRLHEDTLYEFDTANATWRAPADTGELKFSQLSSQGNGKLYAQTGDALVDLSSQDVPHIQVPGLKAFSVSADQHAATLSGDQQQTLHLIDLDRQPVHLGQAITLDLNGGLAEPKHIGLSRERLFVSDTEGRLYSAKREDLAHASTLSLMPDRQFQPTGETLGAARQVTGFLPGDKGDLHVLLADKSGQRHSHPLQEDRQRLGEGWNLSDALVLDNKRGLPGSTAPSPAATLDLERSGRIGLSDQRVQTWDSTSRDWKDAGIKGVSTLQRGQDSKAYLLKDGALHKLEVKAHYSTLSVGATQTLNQPPRSTKVALGDALPDLAGRTLTAFAMLNEKQFVALDSDGRITAHHKQGKATDLSRDGLPGTVRTLALDEHHDLFALTSDGTLHTLAKDDWQAGAETPRPEARWKSVPLPGGHALAGIRTADDNSLSVTLKITTDHSQLQLKGHTWQPLTPRAADQNALSDLFANLRGGEKTARIPGTGLTARFSTTLAGRSTDGANRASTSEFIRANIFKPTLETPRVLKNIGNHIQHAHHGREGLRPLYDAQGPLFTRLEALAHDTPAAPAGHDLKSRIARLDLGPQGADLLKELEAFRGELEDNSLRAAQHLGQQHGKSKLLGQREGLLNIHGELSAPSQRTQLSMKLGNLAEKLNLSSSGHDLIKELQGALRHVAPSGDNRTSALLTSLHDAGMRLSHQKADIPLGQRRDAGDSVGLVKARLALDVVTLKDLSAVLDKAERPGAELDAVKKDLARLRDKGYGEHPVKQVTDMGFVDHANLEASYDGVKAFLNGFKKDDHATSVNLRAATGSKNQAELADNLKATLKQLDHADDEISLQRGYALNLSTPFVSLANKGMGPWPNGSLGAGRNYTFTAERGTDGITVYLQRDGAGSVAGGVGGGKDFWPGFFKPDEVSKFTAVDIGNQRVLTPAFRLGVDLTAASTTTQRDGVTFNVPDEQIDQFVDHLFEGKLNPLELMSKGVKHEAQTGLRFNFDLNAGASAEFRIGLGLTEKGASPLTAAARFGAGASVNVNLLNYSANTLEHHANQGQLQETSQNRPRLLNSFGGSLFARAQLAGSNTPATSATQPASQGVVAPLGAAVAGVIDDKTTKRIKFNFKEAEPLKDEGLKKLAKSLGDAFKDPASQRQVQLLGDDNHAGYLGLEPKDKLHKHLQGLEQHFAEKPVHNDEQYAALRALKRAGVQHSAAEAKHSLLDGARFESSYTNLSRLDSQGMVSKLMSLASPMHSPSNAERVRELLSQDPTLKALVKDLQGTPGTLARVRLELKDSVQDRIDQGSRSGDLTQKELAGLLTDRDNLRIKAITVYRSVSQPENFTSPLPLVSYSSNASVSLNKALGKVNFEYGQDQDTPKRYTVDGELSKPGKALQSAVESLKKEGMELKG